MITAAIINGIAKVIWVRKDQNKSKRIARIYSLSSVEPERIVEETIPGVFRDKINKERFSFDEVYFKQVNHIRA